MTTAPPFPSAAHRSWLDGGPIGRYGDLLGVVEYDSRIYCSPTCLGTIRVLPSNPDANAIWADEVPADGIVCSVCGQRHGAGINAEGVE